MVRILVAMLRRREMAGEEPIPCMVSADMTGSLLFDCSSGMWRVVDGARR